VYPLLPTTNGGGIPPFIPLCRCSKRGVNAASEKFLENFEKFKQLLKNPFKNSRKFLENRETLDFTLIEMLFIIIQVLVMMVVFISHTLKIFLDTP
jgi:hypothetical protein